MRCILLLLLLSNVTAVGSPFDKEEAVLKYLQGRACSQKTPLPIEEMLQIAAATSIRDTYTSPIFRQDLVRHLRDWKPEVRSALEIGVGSSGTSLVLATLFCKLFLLEVNASVLSWASTQGLPHVVHLHADSTKDVWEHQLAQERPPIDFVYVDGSHNTPHVLRDVAKSMSLLTATEGNAGVMEREPLMCFHDTNLRSVRVAVAMYKAAGALHKCKEIGERLPLANDGHDEADPALEPLLLRCRMHGCPEHKEPLYSEAELCHVNLSAAAALTFAAAPDHRSLMPFPGTIWHIFDQVNPTVAWGVMQMFADSVGAQEGKMIIRQNAVPKRTWEARWRVQQYGGVIPPASALHFPVLRVDLEKLAPGLAQSGVVVISKSRTSMTGLFRAFGLQQPEPQIQRAVSREGLTGPCHATGTYIPDAFTCAPPLARGGVMNVSRGLMRLYGWIAVANSVLEVPLEMANHDWFAAAASPGSPPLLRSYMQ